MGLRYVALIIGFAACVGLFGYAAQPDREDRPTRAVGVSPPKDHKFTAAIGCAAASCHGSGDIGKPGSEHTTWSSSDPHTKAYQVLRNEDSQRISKNLGRSMPAYEDASCLKCHAVDEERYVGTEKMDTRAHYEGVGCEGCHGPSSKWNNLHYLPYWKALSDREKFEQYGFIPTKDPVARMLTCVQCHVGARDREVNHDLIAAGHPRLSFEYARFHYSEEYAQKHWQEKSPNPDFEVRTWFIGQVASLRAAADLLFIRSYQASEKKAPWPEFAESSCYACHQNLGAELRSHTMRTEHPRKPGVLGYQLWYTSFAKKLPAIAAVLDPSGKAPTPSTLDTLRTEMEKPSPDPAKVANAARVVFEELDAVLLRYQSTTIGTNLSADQVKKLASIVTENVYDKAKEKLTDYDWDVLAQNALALTAIYHGAGGASNPAVAGWKDSLVDVRTKLSFPMKGPRVDSPRDFKPDSVYAGFRKLYELTH